MHNDQGASPDSAATPLKRRILSRRKHAGKHTGVQPGPNSASVAMPCVNDPAKDCILCSEFDECSFVDRRSSLNSVGFSLVFTIIVIFALVLWFLFH